jgi:hypothetical protein
MYGRVLEGTTSVADHHEQVKLALQVCIRVGYKKDWCITSFV